jgi:hypothetical protein
VAAAPSLALGPRRRSLLGFGRILIYRNVGGPIAVESTYRVDAQKLAVLLIDCDRHALRQEGAISLRNLGRSELFQSRTVILRYEFENPFGIRLGLTADDRSGDARGLRHRRQRQRQNCNKSGLVHSSRPPSLSSLAFHLLMNSMGDTRLQSVIYYYTAPVTAACCRPNKCRRLISACELLRHRHERRVMGVEDVDDFGEI